MNSTELEQALSQLSTSLPSPSKSKNQMPGEALKSESGLWRIISDGLKKTGRKIETTRLESWAIPGVPDVLLCSESGVFTFIELKVQKSTSGKVNLSPHQVAWMTRHRAGPAFIVVRDGSLSLHVFAGSEAVDLRMDGLASVEALAVFEEPYDWTAFFSLTSPL